MTEFDAFKEEAALAVASLTGIRNQLIDAGWTIPNAELVVIEMIRKSDTPQT